MQGLSPAEWRVLAAWVSGLACGLSTLVLARPAASQSIAPVLVELTPARRVATITLDNTSGQSKVFQADTLAWTQRQGEDAYAPSTALIVTPAIVEIPAGKTQVFRVALRHSAPAAQEVAYRLILEDITDADRAGGTKATVNLRLRFSLPLFAATRTEGSAAPAWSPCRAPAGKRCIRLDNHGERRFRFAQLVGETSGWKGSISAGDTVLVGGWKSWIFDLPPSAEGPLSIKAMTATGLVSIAPAPLPAS